MLTIHTIDFVHKVKYLGVLLCSNMKTSIDVLVSRQTSSMFFNNTYTMYKKAHKS